MATPRKTGMFKRLIGHLRRTLVAGLFLLVPLVITYVVVTFLFNSIDGVLQPVVARLFGRDLPGVGIVAFAILVYVAGLFAANFLGRRLIRLGQATLLRIPVVSAVYSPAKQLVESFSATSTTGFRRVVWIEYPRKGAWTVGFLTGITRDEADRPLAVVYVPTAPTPTTGWVAVLPLEDCFDSDLSVREAMQFVLSGGIVTPPRIRRLPPPSPDTATSPG